MNAKKTRYQSETSQFRGGRVALTPPVTKTGCLVFIVFQVFESLSLNLSVESGVIVKLILIRVLCPYGLELLILHSTHV